MCRGERHSFWSDVRLSYPRESSIPFDGVTANEGLLQHSAIALTEVVYHLTSVAVENA
jgi:hypothetical protein